MPHVLVAGRIHSAGLALLQAAAGVTVEMVEAVSEASYVARIEDADALILRTQPLTAATVAKATNLRVVARHGVGYDAVDVAALDARGIPLAIVGEVNAGAVAEHTLMLMLAAIKRLVAGDRAVRTGDWGWRNRLEAGELAGKRLSVIGYGRIGRRVARLAHAFEMDVVVHDPHLAPDAFAGEPVTPAPNLAAALAGADVVSVHAPKADGPVLGRAELARLAPGAVVVNTARGGVIDEAALAEALAAGQLGAAGLDVFGAEPPPADHPLVACGRAVLSPHTAGLTVECAERMAVAAARNVLDHFAGRLDPALVVNLKGARP